MNHPQPTLHGGFSQTAFREFDEAVSIAAHDERRPREITRGGKRHSRKCTSCR